MLYAAVGGFGALVTWLVVMDQRTKRRLRARDARRDARQRNRIRDWTVMQWVFGSRANLRITDRRGADD
ncbi:hypothetical protein OF829_11625 [Sphingomonas sp. LB-2]|uniref:hypothetical protein n=1 Tax=Sphingomonas caeni TaxID=2984949 RepID=UPI0022306EF5|nr:hypothetical protein [Sphingomonas caeni]MCW3847890.1 hypothetical protein [Sphingomonas caeni]